MTSFLLDIISKHTWMLQKINYFCFCRRSNQLVPKCLLLMLLISTEAVNLILHCSLYIIKQTLAEYDCVLIIQIRMFPNYITQKLWWSVLLCNYMSLLGNCQILFGFV